MKISVIKWLPYPENKPKNVVKEYLTLDINEEIKTLEWYEGDYFESCGLGHWQNEESEEINNVIYYAEKPTIKDCDKFPEWTTGIGLKSGDKVIINNKECIIK